MKLALVHDWLLTRGGAERVLLRFHHLWPKAPIFTLAADKRFLRKWLPDADVRASWPRRLPFGTWTAPLLPSVVESMDFADYDAVLSSSPIFAKGVITRATTRHVCYCYSPARQLWDRAHAYERRGMIAGFVRHGLRLWDRQAGQRPDAMVAISKTVQRRISTYYRRESDIIVPGLLDGTEQISLGHGGFYLAVGRLVPHKNYMMLADVFAKLRRPLVIVGSGPQERTLRRKTGPFLRLVTNADDRELRDWYRTCRALIVANEEDFGLTPVEAMAHGKPVIALRAGGATETVIEGMSGEFFDDAIPECIADAIIRFERGSYDPRHIAVSTTPYRVETFDTAIRSLMNPNAHD